MSPAAERGPFPGAPLILILAALAALQLHAFRWGVITPDTVFQWGQALSGRYDDWHPPATTWLWRQLMRLGPGTAPILTFDCLLYWTGVWLIADALRWQGRPWAMAAAVACAALPIPFGQMGAILKDPLLAACCLVASGLLLRFGKEKAAAAAAFALLLFATATRFNALFATAPLLAAWRPGRRPIVALAVAAVVLAAGAWAIDNLALRPHHSQPVFSLVNFDLAGIAAQGGAGAYPNLSRAAERRQVSACYDPGQFNPTYRADCDGMEEALRAYAVRSGRSALSIWSGAILGAPGAYLRHRLAHLNRNLRFAVPDVPRDAVYVMTTANPYGLGFRENGATRLVARAAQAMALSPLGRPATWLAVALGLLPIARGRFAVGVSLSVLLYGLAYGAASVAPDMRYNFWTMLGGMMALVVAWDEIGAAPPRRIMAAAVPVALVVAVELAALLA